MPKVGRSGTLTVSEIPVPSKFKHPDAPYDILPKHEFTMGIIAPKGSGKTTLICNLLEFYKGYFHTIYVFSPTVNSDEKWDYIKRQPLLADNKPLKKFLRDYKMKKSKINGPVQKPSEPIPEIPIINDPEHKHDDEEKFDPHIPEDCFIEDYTPDMLQELMEGQMTMVKFLRRNGMSKHLANRVLIIFDDLVGSNLYSLSQQNPFKKFNTNHRHYSFSAIEITQAYKEIPKTVRTNFTCGVLFEIPSDKELEVIYEEYPLGLKRKEWDEVYNYCTHDDYGFMFYNFQKPRRLRICKNLDKYIAVADDSKGRDQMVQ